jgi:hypothetical protein
LILSGELAHPSLVGISDLLRFSALTEGLLLLPTLLLIAGAVLDLKVKSSRLFCS